MTTPSARLGLLKPSPSDPFVTADLATNWQTLDNAPGVLLSTSANHPATWGTVHKGMEIRDTDTLLKSVWDGAAFQSEQGYRIVANAAALPSTLGTAQAGLLAVTLDTGDVRRWTGTGWAYVTRGADNLTLVNNLQPRFSGGTAGSYSSQLIQGFRRDNYFVGSAKFIWTNSASAVWLDFLYPFASQWLTAAGVMAGTWMHSNASGDSSAVGFLETTGTRVITTNTSATAASLTVASGWSTTLNFQYPIL